MTFPIQCDVTDEEPTGNLPGVQILYFLFAQFCKCTHSHDVTSNKPKNAIPQDYPPLHDEQIRHVVLCVRPIKWTRHFCECSVATNLGFDMARIITIIYCIYWLLLLHFRSSIIIIAEIHSSWFCQNCCFLILSFCSIR